MIKSTQKQLIHEYARAAKLEDATYRNFLLNRAGVTSSADPSMTQRGFELLMAALEIELFRRVASGQVPSPIGHSRNIRSETYWRDRCPDRGRATTRQMHEVWEMAGRLFGHGSLGQFGGYLEGMAERATGRAANIEDLSVVSASALIDALRDRLASQVKPPSTADQEASSVPF